MVCGAHWAHPTVEYVWSVEHTGPTLLWSMYGMWSTLGPPYCGVCMVCGAHWAHPTVEYVWSVEHTGPTLLWSTLGPPYCGAHWAHPTVEHTGPTLLWSTLGPPYCGDVGNKLIYIFNKSKRWYMI